MLRFQNIKGGDCKYVSQLKTVAVRFNGKRTCLKRKQT